MPYKNKDDDRACRLRHREKNNVAKRRSYLANKDVLNARCKAWWNRVKDEQNAARRQARQENLEEARAAARAQWKVNKDKLNEARRRKVKNDPEHAAQLRLRAKKRYALLSSNPDWMERERLRSLDKAHRFKERQAEQQRVAREADPERFKRYRLKYYDKTTWLTYVRKRQALQRGAIMGDEKEIKRYYQHVRSSPSVTCFYCQREIPFGSRTVDHLTPLSRGGAHAIDNFVPACARCNKSKNNRTAQEFIAWRNARLTTA